MIDNCVYIRSRLMNDLDVIPHREVKEQSGYKIRVSECGEAIAVLRRGMDRQQC